MPQWTSHAYCTLQWINHQVSLTPVMRHWLLCEKTTFSYGERWCLCSLVFLSLTNLSFHHLQRLEMLAPRESVLNVFITSNDTHYQTQRGKWVESFQNPNYKFSKWPNRKFKKPSKHNPDIRFHSLIGQLPAGPCLVTDDGMSCLRIRSPTSVRCGCAWPQLTDFGSWLAVHACFMVRGDLFVDCIYDKQVWDKRKILNQQWVHPCLLHSQGGLFVYCIYVYQLWYNGKTSLMWSWWWKASFAPIWALAFFLFGAVSVLYFELG